jgi:hypothetical protein
MEANRDDWDPAATAGAEAFAYAGMPEEDLIDVVETELFGGSTESFDPEPELPDFDEFIEGITDAPDPGGGTEATDRFRSFRERFQKRKAVEAWCALKVGRVSAGRVIEASPAYLRGAVITSLVAAQPGWDIDAAARHLEQLSIDPVSKLKDLTAEERARVEGSLPVRPA